MLVKKEKLLKIFVIIWLLLATLYVGYDLWARYMATNLNVAYQQGISDMVTQAFDQLEKNKCQPMDMYKDEKKVQLIDIECLQQPTEESTTIAK